MKVKQAFIFALKELKSIYPEGEATSISKWILEDLGYKITPLSDIAEKDMDENSNQRLKEILIRLSKHEPIQHILGYSWFYGKKFIVSSATLIPRQETELLVDTILKNLDENYAGTILDIGTGSGIIACSLANKLIESNVFGSDISKSALEIARLNANNLNLNLSFIEDNILEPDMTIYPEVIDLIVSNPPYVRNSERKLMQKNVLDFEPGLALFVDDNDPLIFYRKIALFSSKKLIKGGKLYFEINEALGENTGELVSGFGFQNIEIIKDLNGKERIIYAEKT